MPRISDTDQAEIFGDAEVVDTVTIAGNSVDGHFFAPYANELSMAGNKPTFRCARADVLTVVTGNTLIHDGTTYVITSKQDDRSGPVTFELRVQ